MAYTTIDDPSAHFQTTLYTGNGSDGYSITNSGNSDLQPDMLWFKNRNSTQGHEIFDSTRGVAASLRPHNTDAENVDSPNDRLMSFDSDGFELDDDGNPNTNNNTYVCWQWKANGGSTTTNDASATGVGNQDSVYQANTTAGFSIVTWTGDSSVGTNAHGLGAVPHVIIVKCRSTNGERWEVYHHKNTSAPETDHLGLSETDATVDSAHTWNDTAPTSTIFTVGNSGAMNENNKTYIAYLFSEKQGYSKFGGYTGNNNADGAFNYTGFKPAFIIIKCTSTASTDWVMYDNKRDINPVGSDSGTLYPNLGNGDSSAGGIDFLSNGFKSRSTKGYHNGSIRTYIYMAFAESPLVSSTGIPATAR